MRFPPSLLLLVVLLCGCDDEVTVEPCASSSTDDYDIAIAAVEVPVSHYTVDGSGAPDYAVYHYRYMVTLANAGDSPINRRLHIWTDIPEDQTDYVFFPSSYRASRHLLVQLAPGEQQTYEISGDADVRIVDPEEPPAQPGPDLVVKIQDIQLYHSGSFEYASTHVLARDTNIDNNLVAIPITILPPAPEVAN